MKGTKDIEESIGYIALIVGIAGSSCAAVLLTLMLAFGARFNLEFITLLSWHLRLMVLLLIIVAGLQVGVLFYKINSKKKICPKCQTPLPKWRIPKDGYEAFVGGWTCPNCGVKFTWQLREREQNH
ncbi:MAG: hypothetical protein WA821_22680 [Anaerolineales bacterium]